MTETEKLEYIRGLAKESSTMKFGRYHLIVNEKEYPFIFKDSVKSGFFAELRGLSNWSFIQCRDAIIRIDERYENKNKGGGSIARSLIGGALFGTAGAVIGGSGGGVQVGTLTRLNINIYSREKSSTVPVIQIPLVQQPQNIQSIYYQRNVDWVKLFIERTTKYGATLAGEERKPNF
ncbi:MAG: hypothetical protein ABF991_00455 [Liquorilactobacillus hordei]|uniref:hypothetical protein n=1 Tax=Liquorilactobacillus hordei TaxID=468911 RepID=UPI0039EAE2E3